MRRRSSGGKSPKLELKLNLSPPRASFTEAVDESPSSEMSIDESCVSSEVEEDEARLQYDSSPGGTASSSMVLGGCPRCLMYIMLSKLDPRCPKCKNTVLIQFSGNEISKKTTS